MQNAVLLLMGPTAAGKTDLAIDLATHYPFEIISVDSALVYRGMDIGTGKPDAALLQRHPHHLVDILDPRESYSAGRFVQDAIRLIADIHSRGRVPLLVGGTLLYFRALLHGLADMPAANGEFRAALEGRALQLGWPALHAELAKHDPIAARRIGLNDGQRIQRALEVMELTGRTLSEVQQEARPPLPNASFTKVALSPTERGTLYTRIEARFAAMMERGFLQEVRQLHQRGDLHPELPSMRAVGYRQLWKHVTREWSLEEASREAILATRHLARRQLMWMRADPDLTWIDAAAEHGLDDLKRRVASLFG